MEFSLGLQKYGDLLNDISLTKEIGKVTQVRGFLMRGYVPAANVGSICEVFSTNGRHQFLAEVIGFEDRHVLMMPLGNMVGVGLGSRIVLKRTRAKIMLGKALLGRVINGLGEPIDGFEKPDLYEEAPLYSETVNPLTRPPINEPLRLGVRAIDGLLTVGKGQRMGIMAGSGVGKSILLGMMARATHADVNIIALIGERGREVREFIEQYLGEEGLKKSVVIVATSDQSPLIRTRGAFLAAAIAEYFCGLNQDVLLMMDSVTRFAMAQREIGLSVGEPPASKGYTPSVFSMLPRLLERAGNFEGKGSITGLYSVLVEGDDMDEPIADAVRSIVDGHIVLTRKLAQKGHFPSIDILQSSSRVMQNIVSDSQMGMTYDFRENLSVYSDAEDLINIGAYKSGANSKIDRAVALHDPMNHFLRQDFRQLDREDNIEESLAQVLGGGADGL